jgi:H+-transporting ATPase
MIITLINDGTLISIGYDFAVPSKYPERWALKILFIVSITLGAVACSSSLILLYFCLTSWDKNGLFQTWGMPGLKYGQIVNCIFLKVAVSDILTLFSARTAHRFAWQRKPHPVLFICALFALSLSTTLSLVWPEGKLDNVPVCGLAYTDQQGHHHPKIALWVWVYCLIVFLIQDCLKVAVWRILIHYNVFNVNNVVEVKDDAFNAPTTASSVELQSVQSHK